MIDESYNANPASMAATLLVLAATPAKRRIAVLGEMRELGAESDALHAGLAIPVKQAGVEIALLIGPGKWKAWRGAGRSTASRPRTVAARP